jgi:hypothetical protein
MGSKQKNILKQQTINLSSSAKELHLYAVSMAINSVNTGYTRQKTISQKQKHKDTIREKRFKKQGYLLLIVL